MDSNYEWQQFRAKERVQARRQEADAQRVVKGGGNGRAPSLRPVMSKAKAA